MTRRRVGGAERRRPGFPRSNADGGNGAAGLCDGRSLKKLGVLASEEAADAELWELGAGKE